MALARSHVRGINYALKVEAQKLSAGGERGGGRAEATENQKKFRPNFLLEAWVCARSLT